MERVWNAFELAEDGRGRRAYVAWLEKRAEDAGGKVDDGAMKALRRGWYLGEPSFVDRLLELIAPGQGRNSVARSHDEAEAERLAVRALDCLGLPGGTGGLAKLRKGDAGKVLVAVLLRKRTSVGNRWIAERLSMGHTGALSRLLGAFQKDEGSVKSLEKLEKMFK